MRSQPHRRRRPDGGMTLIELVVSIAIIGLLATVIAAAISVTFRQQLDTDGRVSAARWEQSLGLWLPTDLSSAEALFDAPSARPTPCVDPVCTFGSNALQLEWDVGGGATTVGYRYGRSTDGATGELRRVECVAGACTSRVILRDLAAPPTSWSDNDPIPAGIISISDPLVVTETDPGGAMAADPLTRRVTVRVNGAPGNDGADRGNTVSFAAGGVSTADLPPASFDHPTFVGAKSGCGGLITLVVDESGSIGGNIANVRLGVRDFVQALAGTPTRLQIVRMASSAGVLGATSWNRYFDLANSTEVTELIGLIPSLDSDPNGNTNWEDALFRSFYDQAGQPLVAAGIEPELVVFFTDGVPTVHRETIDGDIHKTDSSSLNPPSIPYAYNFGRLSTGIGMSPLAWYRARWIREQFPDVRMIGVGAGDAFVQDTDFSTVSPPWVPAVPNRVLLGEMVAADSFGTPHNYSGTNDFTQVPYNGGWGDVSNADLLTTDDWSQLSSALTAIALDECGGSLTVQTRLDGAPAAGSVTYAIGAETVTTSQIARSGAFDVDFGGAASTTVQLVPDLSATPYSAVDWSCRSGGSVHAGYSVLPGGPASGVSVPVSANEAVACTLNVTR